MKYLNCYNRICLFDTLGIYKYSFFDKGCFESTSPNSYTNWFTYFDLLQVLTRYPTCLTHPFYEYYFINTMSHYFCRKNGQRIFTLRPYVMVEPFANWFLKCISFCCEFDKRIRLHFQNLFSRRGCFCYMSTCATCKSFSYACCRMERDLIIERKFLKEKNET